ncbi:hypothetical protein LCGC14_0914990 [marine sediment metagenome]|uniref:Uncharacterized protein n=1 Tax=marine sediment metagenome TaxID=412755 RepID=A0A0F9NX89_9ZZZZ
MAFKGKYGIATIAASRGIKTYIGVGHCDNCGKDVRHDSSIDLEKWAAAEQELPSDNEIERQSLEKMKSRHTCDRVGPNKAFIFMPGGTA